MILAKLRAPIAEQGRKGCRGKYLYHICHQTISSFINWAVLPSTFLIQCLRILLYCQVFKDFHINENQSLFKSVMVPLALLQIISKQTGTHFILSIQYHKCSLSSYRWLSLGKYVLRQFLKCILFSPLLFQIYWY